MKKEFGQFIKEMRTALHPRFDEVNEKVTNKKITSQEHDKEMNEICALQDQMIQEAGYSEDEFNVTLREYYLDFSSRNPEEWIIRHDPEHAQIIIHHD